jgi:hypothetical protein
MLKSRKPLGAVGLLFLVLLRAILLALCRD